MSQLNHSFLHWQGGVSRLPAARHILVIVTVDPHFFPTVVSPSLFNGWSPHFKVSYHCALPPMSQPLYSIDMSPFLLESLEQISLDLKVWMIHLEEEFHCSLFNSRSQRLVMSVLPVSVDWPNSLQCRLGHNRHKPFHIECMARQGWQDERSTNYLQNFQVCQMHGDWRFSFGCILPVSDFIIGRSFQIDQRCLELSGVCYLVKLLPG